jgi:aminoglycoside phosphotransferase (APT) family kinase protein
MVAVTHPPDPRTASSGAPASPPDARAVCDAFGLPAPLAAMTRVPGGLTHRLWRLETSEGAFAVKEISRDLNRPDFFSWLDRAFTLERAAYDAGVMMPRPVPALATSGCLAQLLGDGDRPTFVRVHEWVDGEQLNNAALYPPGDAARIAAQLARIHALGMHPAAGAPSPLKVADPAYWRELADRCARAGQRWAGDFRALLPVIDEMEAYVAAARDDPTPPVLSHRDADAKNTLRTAAGELLLVDWDAAGPVHPRHDLANTALVWAGVGLGEPDEAVLRAFLDAYRAAGGATIRFEGSDLAEMVSVHIWWIDFNIRRALGDGFDARERDVGSAFAMRALQHGKLRRYATSLERWIALLNG